MKNPPRKNGPPRKPGPFLGPKKGLAAKLDAQEEKILRRALWRRTLHPDKSDTPQLVKEQKNKKQKKKKIPTKADERAFLGLLNGKGRRKSRPRPHGGYGPPRGNKIRIKRPQKLIRRPVNFKRPVFKKPLNQKRPIHAFRKPHKRPFNKGPHKKQPSKFNKPNNIDSYGAPQGDVYKPESQDSYGAPLGKPSSSYGGQQDSYGAPLGKPSSSYRSQQDSYGAPQAEPFGNEGAGFKTPDFGAFPTFESLSGFNNFDDNFPATFDFEVPKLNGN